MVSIRRPDARSFGLIGSHLLYTCYNSMSRFPYRLHAAPAEVLQNQITRKLSQQILCPYIYTQTHTDTDTDTHTHTPTHTHTHTRTYTHLHTHTHTHIYIHSYIHIYIIYVNIY